MVGYVPDRSDKKQRASLSVPFQPAYHSSTHEVMIDLDPITYADFRRLAWSYMERADTPSSAKAIREAAGNLFDQYENGRKLTYAEVESYFWHVLNGDF
jgi:hypothetical protein